MIYINSKYKIPKEMIVKILNEKGKISEKEVIDILEPYITIDIEKLKEQEIGRLASRMLAAHKKRQISIFEKDIKNQI